VIMSKLKLWSRFDTGRAADLIRAATSVEELILIEEAIAECEQRCSAQMGNKSYLDKVMDERVEHLAALESACL
jgi:hypothetical protein